MVPEFNRCVWNVVELLVAEDEPEAAAAADVW